VSVRLPFLDLDLAALIGNRFSGNRVTTRFQIVGILLSPDRALELRSPLAGHVGSVETDREKRRNQNLVVSHPSILHPLVDVLSLELPRRRDDVPQSGVVRLPAECLLQPVRIRDQRRWIALATWTDDVGNLLAGNFLHR